MSVSRGLGFLRRHQDKQECNSDEPIRHATLVTFLPRQPRITVHWAIRQGVRSVSMPPESCVSLVGRVLMPGYPSAHALRRGSDRGQDVLRRASSVAGCIFRMERRRLLPSRTFCTALMSFLCRRRSWCRAHSPRWENSSAKLHVISLKREAS